MYGRVVFTLVGVLKCMGELFLHLWEFQNVWESCFYTCGSFKMYGRVVFTLVGVLKCMGELFLHLWEF